MHLGCLRWRFSDRHASMRRITALGFASLLLGCILLLLILRESMPAFHSAVVRTDKTEKSVEFPVRQVSGEKHVTVEVVMSVTFPVISRYRIVFDDCLEALRINGQEVRELTVPVCTLSGRIVDLSKYLQTGENVVTASIKDTGGYLVFAIQPALSDFFYVTSSLLIIALVVCVAVFFLYLRFRQRTLLHFSGIFLVSSWLHWFFVTVTPYYVRAWDWKGHIEYIDFVAQHWRIPAAQGGWEFYQPPLYYFLAALWMKLSALIQSTREQTLFGLQLWSLVCTMAAIVVAMWIARQLFHKKAQALHAVIFSAIIATFPGITLFSFRISNDIPFLLISFLSMALLLRWWRNGSRAEWYLLVAVFTVGLLVKSNTIALIAVAVLCLVAKRDMPAGEKWKQAWYSLALLSLITFWLFALRFFVEGERFVVGNRLSSKLQITNSFSHFLTFNPIRVVRFPFNDNYSDIGGRQYFWEYLYKSAFFGEWKYSPAYVARIMFVLYFFVLLAAAVGMVQSLRRECYRTFPLFIALMIGLLTLIEYRLISPFSPNQDFRFIPFIIIPLTYYFVSGLYVVCKPKKIQFAVLGLSVILMNIFFVLGLIVQPV